MAKAKKEVGYDLDQTFTGTENGTAHTTEEGELMSNFMETAINEIAAKTEEVKEIVAEVVETVEQKVDEVVDIVEEKVDAVAETVETVVKTVKVEIVDEVTEAKAKAAKLMAWILRG